jgi:hypothetical protein
VDADFDALMATDHAYTVAAKLDTYADPTSDPTGWYYENKLISVKTTHTIFSNSNPTIGGVVASQIDLSVFVGDYTPDALTSTRVPIWLYLTAGKTSDVDTHVTGFSLGPWYLDAISYDRMTGVLTVRGYDKLADSDIEYMRCVSRTRYGTGEDAITPLELAQDIAVILGVALTSETQAKLTILSGVLPTVARPDEGTTIRELLQWLSGSCGCNVRITRGPDVSSTVEYLEFVPFCGMREHVNVGSAVGKLKINGLSSNSNTWGVYLLGDEITYGYRNAGSTDTAIFQLDDPLVDQAPDPGAVASSAHQTIWPGWDDGPWDYQGFTASDVILDMRAECGDLLHIEYPTTTGDTVTADWYIGEIVRTYDHACACSVSAPEMAKPQHETAYVGASS